MHMMVATLIVSLVFCSSLQTTIATDVSEDHPESIHHHSSTIKAIQARPQENRATLSISHSTRPDYTDIDVQSHDGSAESIREVPVNGMLFVSTVDGQFHGVDLQSGELKWSVRHGDDPLVSSAAASFSGSDTDGDAESVRLLPGIDGSVYAASQQFGVHQLDFTMPEIAASAASFSQTTKGKTLLGLSNVHQYMFDKRTGRIMKHWDGQGQYYNSAEAGCPQDENPSDDYVWFQKSEWSVREIDRHSNVETWNMSLARFSSVFNMEDTFKSGKLLAKVLPRVRTTVNGELSCFASSNARSPAWNFQLDSPVSSVHVLFDAAPESEPDVKIDRIKLATDYVLEPDLVNRIFDVPVKHITYMATPHSVQSSASTDSSSSATPNAATSLSTRVQHQPSNSTNTTTGGLYVGYSHRAGYFVLPSVEATSGTNQPLVASSNAQPAVDSRTHLSDDDHEHVEDTQQNSHDYELDDDDEYDGDNDDDDHDLDVFDNEHVDDFDEDDAAESYASIRDMHTVPSRAVQSYQPDEEHIFGFHPVSNQGTSDWTTSSARATLAGARTMLPKTLWMTTAVIASGSDEDEYDDSGYRLHPRHHVHDELDLDDNPSDGVTFSIHDPNVPDFVDDGMEATSGSHSGRRPSSQSKVAIATAGSLYNTAMVVLATIAVMVAVTSAVVRGYISVPDPIRAYIVAQLGGSAKPTNSTDSSEESRPHTPSLFEPSTENSSNTDSSSGVESSTETDSKQLAVRLATPQVVNGTLQIGKLKMFTESILGTGSQGTVVYHGEYDGRHVAVKRLVKPFYGLAEAQKEIELLIDSDEHPNVLRYFAKEETDDFIYLALERCAGTLSDLVGDCRRHSRRHGPSSTSNSSTQSRTLDSSSAAYLPARLGFTADSHSNSSEVADSWEMHLDDDIKAQVSEHPLFIEHQQLQRDDAKVLMLLQSMVEGVAHLHQINIVHRDLKPQNILLTESLRVKIADMGLGKKLDGHRSSWDSRVSGSVGWQPPEVITEDSNRRLTRAVDVFSIGCVMYYVLTHGKHPYGSEHERQSNIAKGKYSMDALHEKLEQLGFAFAPEAEDLIDSMIQPDPVRRITAEEALHHPLFWPDEKKLNFLLDTSDRLESEHRGGFVESVFHQHVGPILNNQSWQHRVDYELIGEMRKYRTYDFYCVRDLLRVVRNKKNHFRELPPNMQAKLGPLPSGYIHYFLKRFPGLLLRSYEVMSCFYHERPGEAGDMVSRLCFNAPADDLNGGEYTDGYESAARSTGSGGGQASNRTSTGKRKRRKRRGASSANWRKNDTSADSKGVSNEPHQNVIPLQKYTVEIDHHFDSVFPDDKQDGDFLIAGIQSCHIVPPTVTMEEDAPLPTSMAVYYGDVPSTRIRALAQRVKIRTRRWF
jgi:serine/threonine protein kinase